MNYLHKRHLVEAELERTRDNHEAARTHYNTAIDLAIENQFVNGAALAAERAGTYYIGIGDKRMAKLYLKESSDYYRQWGALPKVRHLEKNFRNFWMRPFLSYVRHQCIPGDMMPHHLHRPISLKQPVTLLSVRNR